MAYPHREAGYNLLLISQWTHPADTDAGIAWARENFDLLAPYMADRSYTNYLSADDYDRVRHAAEATSWVLPTVGMPDPRSRRSGVLRDRSSGRR